MGWERLGEDVTLASYVCEEGRVVCGIDWLTATRPGDSWDNPLYALGEALLRLEDPSEARTSPWVWQGYVGGAVAGISVGRRPDGSIVRLSGNAAFTWWAQVMKCCTNVSRIDLAVTVTLDPPEKGISADAWKSIKKWTCATGRPPKYSMFVDSLGGSTFYIGSRSSDYYARLYDKGVESGNAEPGKAWRWEVEVKGDPAKQVAIAVRDASDQAAYIAAYVHDHFSSRGCPPRFDRGMALLRNTNPHTPADINSRLEWLASAVRPALYKLSACGYLTEALRALDISELTGYNPTSQPEG